MQLNDRYKSRRTTYIDEDITKKIVAYFFDPPCIKRGYSNFVLISADDVLVRANISVVDVLVIKLKISRTPHCLLLNIVYCLSDDNIK